MVGFIVGTPSVTDLWFQEKEMQDTISMKQLTFGKDHTFGSQAFKLSHEQALLQRKKKGKNSQK